MATYQELTANIIVYGKIMYIFPQDCLALFLFLYNAHTLLNFINPLPDKVTMTKEKKKDSKRRIPFSALASIDDIMQSRC